MWLHAANNPCRTDASENKSIKSRINEITRTILKVALSKIMEKSKRKPEELEKEKEQFRKKS